MDTVAFIQARITATKTSIVAYEEAELALATGAIQEYMIDTGQTRQRVTKLNLKDLTAAIDALYNRCTMLEVRLNGTGVIIGKPGW